MASTLHQVQTAFEGTSLTFQVVLGAAILGLVYALLTGDRPIAGFPVVRPTAKGWQKLIPDRFLFMTQGHEVIMRGLREQPGAFQISTATGYKLVLPNRFADEVKNSPNLSFNMAFKPDLFVNYPGMDGNREGLKDSTFIQEIVRQKLTQSLGLVTADLVDETNDALHTIFGEPSDWKTVAVKDNVLDIVARLSARVFLGIELCRDARWLQISKDYTIDTFVAARLLRMTPGLVRPIVYWFIPTCTRLRKEVRDARALIEPEIQRRIKRTREALASGQKPPKSSDTIAWMVECAKDRDVDFVAAQLSLTTAAIHTTSEAMLKCLIQLGRSPEIADALRQEMIDVLRTDGWAKTTLYKMKLLDSFLKEVQRHSGMTLTSMNRYVSKPITLSDGTQLPVGSRFMVTDDKPKDNTVYPNADKFDAARFLRLREQPGEENRHQFVTTANTHMAFGHGQHACPGRFFASNEIKIALTFFLLKYEIRHVPGPEKPTSMMFEQNAVSLPVDMQIRRRREELDLMSPQA